ncbi:MAG: hypothetical protein RLZZ453_1120 [Chlamydiota bacterium]|jgi:hypothetical protein
MSEVRAFSLVSSLGAKPPQVAGIDLVVQSFSDQIKNLLKMFNYVAYWTGAKSIVGVATAATDAVHFKNLLSGLELLKKSKEVVTAGSEALAKGTASAVYGVAVKSAGWFNSFADAASYVNRYVPVAALPVINNLNVGATLFYSSDGFVEQCGNMVAAKTPEQATLTLLKMSMNVCYVAFGVFMLSWLAMGVAPVVPIMLGCLTSATAFGLAGYFFEKVYDPYNTNESLDWSKLKKMVQVA